MLDKTKSLEMLQEFQSHYNYDTNYMKEMLEANTDAFETFQNFLPMATFKEKTPIEVLFTIKLATIKNEDCGACLQLNINMALEAGVNQEIIKEIVFNEGKNLNSELKEIYDFTLNVVNNNTIHPDIYDKINKKYSRDIMVEIALAISSAKVFPTIKRVMNDFHECSLIKIKI